MINNDAKTLADSFGTEEPAIFCENSLIGNLGPTIHDAAFGIFAETTIHLWGFTIDSGELEFNRNIFTLKVQRRHFVNIDCKVLILNLALFIPAIFQEVERLGNCGLHNLD